MERMKYEVLEKSFMKKNPDGAITRSSGSVQVRFNSHGYYYTYKGNNNVIAKKLHLDITPDVLQEHTISLGINKEYKIVCIGRNDKKIEINVAVRNEKVFIDWPKECVEYMPMNVLSIYKSAKGHYFNLFGHRQYIPNTGNASELNGFLFC